MSLKPWYILFLGLAVISAPVSVQPAFADEDGFDLGDEADLEADDVFADGDNPDITFDDGGSGDSIGGSVGDANLNDGAGLANVKDFDIAGIMLGMPFEDVYSLYYTKSGLYTLRNRNSLVYTIPDDWKYNLDYECRQSGVVQPSKLDKCIRGLARSRGLLYVSELHLERVKTGETIDVYFTSNATDNVVYRVVYGNDADTTEGAAQKFKDQRDKKVLAFWKTVIKKYGAPNSGDDTWITSTNQFEPKMKAYFGGLDLVDEGRHALDAAEASKQSREYFRAKPYAF